MKIVPGINRSCHHHYAGCRVEGLDDYIAKGAVIKKKFGFDAPGFDIGVSGGIDAFKRHDSGFLLEMEKKPDDAGLVPVPVMETLEIHPDPAGVKTSILALEWTMEEAFVLGGEERAVFQFFPREARREKGVGIVDACPGSEHLGGRAGGQDTFRVS